MGMAVSIDVRNDVGVEPGVADAVAWLHHVDQTFSPYRDDSPITLLGRGAAALDDMDDEVRSVLADCDRLRLATGGIFDPWKVPAVNGARLDPSGYVKGWAVERAAHALEAHGPRDFLLNAGGDLAVRGAPMPDASWNIGLRDPHDPQAVAALIGASGSVAVATSGTYERGAHIIDPRTGSPTAPVTSATVIGPDLGIADAYATTVFVLGVEGLDWIAEQVGYDAIVMTHDDEIVSTATERSTRSASWRLTRCGRRAGLR